MARSRPLASTGAPSTGAPSTGAPGTPELSRLARRAPRRLRTPTPTRLQRAPAMPRTPAPAGSPAGAGNAAHQRQAGSPGGRRQCCARQRQAGHPRPKALRTSCRSVAHIGDSTSVDLISPDYLPDPAQRLGARYAAVGVRHLKIDASGGRSIVEELPGQVNGYKVASAWQSQGYRGCWVFALGTNDAANVAAGSTIGLMARIDQMMAVAHGQPVMWVNTRHAADQRTVGQLRTSRPGTRRWSRRWPSTRTCGSSTGRRSRSRAGSCPTAIHYNSPGCAIRAKAIADALARAFPLPATAQADRQ